MELRRGAAGGFKKQNNVWEANSIELTRVALAVLRFEKIIISYCGRRLRVACDRLFVFIKFKIQFYYLGLSVKCLHSSQSNSILKLFILLFLLMFYI